MTRITLEKYYNAMFKHPSKFRKQEFKEINRGHVINSEYFDVHCSHHSLLYRDKFNHLRISVESDMSHTLIIYFDSFLKTNPANSIHGINSALLKNRLSGFCGTTAKTADF